MPHTSHFLCLCPQAIQGKHRLQRWVTCVLYHEFIGVTTSSAGHLLVEWQMWIFNPLVWALTGRRLLTRGSLLEISIPRVRVRGRPRISRGNNVTNSLAHKDTGPNPTAAIMKYRRCPTKNFKWLLSHMKSQEVCLSYHLLVWIKGFGNHYSCFE